MLNCIDSEGPSRKKKRRSQSNNKRQRSLSPLSKRMAQLGEDASRTHNSQFNHPYGYQPPPPDEPHAPAHAPHPPQRSQADIDYELKVFNTSKKVLNILSMSQYTYMVVINMHAPTGIYNPVTVFCAPGVRIAQRVMPFLRGA